MRRRSFKRRVVKVSAVAFVASVVMAAPAFADRWEAPGGGPVTVCFKNTDLPAGAVAAAKKAAVQWNRASMNLNVVFGKCPEGANVVKLGDRKMEGSVLGNTEWLPINERIVSANVTFDADSIDDWGGSVGGVSKAWAGVMCHELGHALGLPHSKERNSCMQTHTPRPYPSPGKADMTQLRELYGGKAKPTKSASVARKSNTKKNAQANMADPAGGDVADPLEGATGGDIDAVDDANTADPEMADDGADVLGDPATEDVLGDATEDAAGGDPTTEDPMGDTEIIPIRPNGGAGAGATTVVPEETTTTTKAPATTTTTKAPTTTTTKAPKVLDRFPSSQGAGEETTPVDDMTDSNPSAGMGDARVPGGTSCCCCACACGSRSGTQTTGVDGTEVAARSGEGTCAEESAQMTFAQERRRLLLKLIKEHQKQKSLIARLR